MENHKENKYSQLQIPSRKPFRSLSHLTIRNGHSLMKRTEFSLQKLKTNHLKVTLMKEKENQYHAKSNASQRNLQKQYKDNLVPKVRYLSQKRNYLQNTNGNKQKNMFKKEKPKLGLSKNLFRNMRVFSDKKMIFPVGKPCAIRKIGFQNKIAGEEKLFQRTPSGEKTIKTTFSRQKTMKTGIPSQDIGSSMYKNARSRQSFEYQLTRLDNTTQKSVKREHMKEKSKIRMRQQNRYVVKNKNKPILIEELRIKSQFFSRVDQLECGVGDRIKLHLDILQELADYSKHLLETYQNARQWQEIAFLVYKKYYLERLKVLHFLNGSRHNPPNWISCCQIINKQAQEFIKLSKCTDMIKEIENKNANVVGGTLQKFYNLIIEKSDEKVNLLLIDNFSANILQEMIIETELLQQIVSQNPRLVHNRIKQVFRTAFLISELNGNFIISYEQSLSRKYILKAKSLCQKLWS